MPGLFTRLLFSLKGGLPATSRYEAKRAMLVKKFEKYNALKQTPNLIRYQELAAQVATPRSQSGLPKKEWKMMRQEFVGLRRSSDVADFFKLQKTSHNFHAITDWELKFEDDFNGKELNAQKWLSRNYAGDAGIDTGYSPANENHVYANKNVGISNQMLKIATKHERATGLGFSDVLGFVPVERNFTSGIVNTGESYQMQYGKVEARIRFTQSGKGMYHAMWLGAGKKLPHINAVRIGDKVEFSAFAADTLADNGIRQHDCIWPRNILRQNTYYIVSVEWSAETIVWRINGVTMLSAQNIVKEPMYLAFSSGVTGAPGTNAHATFEVDWVKAYQRHEQSLAV